MSDVNKITGSVELSANDSGLLETLKKLDATLNSIDKTMATFSKSASKAMDSVKEKAEKVEKVFKPTQVQIEKLEASFNKLSNTKYGASLAGEMNKFKQAADAGFKSAEDKALALYRVQNSISEAVKKAAVEERTRANEAKKQQAELERQANQRAKAIEKQTKALERQAAAAKRAASSERTSSAPTLATASLTQLDNMRDKLNKMNEALGRIGASGSANYQQLAKQATHYFRSIESGSDSQEKLSQTMNRFNKVTTDIVARVKEQERAAANLAKILNKNDLATVQLTQSLRHMGASSDDIAKVTQALRDYKTAVASAGGDQAKLTKAQNDYSIAIGEVKRANHNGSVVAFEAARQNGMMKDTLTQAAQAAQLALGPLAGLAYRLTVMKSMLNSTTFGITAMISSLVALHSVLTTTIRIGMQYEQELAAIATIIQDDFNGALEDSTHRLMDFSREFAAFTLAGTQETRRAIVAINTFGASVQRLTPEVLLAAKGLQSAFGGTLVDRVRLVGKVLEDPLANMASLKQAGVVLDEQMKSNIKFMTMMGQRGQAQGVILDKLGKFMNLAAGEAKGLSGTWDTLSEKYLELQESFSQELGITHIWSDAIVSITDLLERLGSEAGVASNLFTLFAGAAVGALTGVSEIVQFLANNFEVLATLAMVAAAVSAGVLINSLLGITVASGSLVTATVSATTALLAKVAATKALMVTQAKHMTVMKAYAALLVLIRVSAVPILVLFTAMSVAASLYVKNMKSAAEATESMKASFASVEKEVSDFTKSFLAQTDERMIALRKEQAETKRLLRQTEDDFSESLNKLRIDAHKSNLLDSLFVAATGGAGFLLGITHRTQTEMLRLSDAISQVTEVEREFVAGGRVLTVELTEKVLTAQELLRTFDKFEDIDLVALFEASARATEHLTTRASELDRTLEALSKSTDDISVDTTALLGVLQNMDGSILTNTEKLNGLIAAEITMAAATAHTTSMVESLTSARDMQLNSVGALNMAAKDEANAIAAVNRHYDHQIWLLQNLESIRKQQRTRELVGDYEAIARSLAKLGKTQEEVAAIELAFDRQDFVTDYMNKVDITTATIEDLSERLQHLGAIANQAGMTGLAQLAESLEGVNDRAEILAATEQILASIAEKVLTPAIKETAKETERAAKDTTSLSDAYRNLIQEAQVLSTHLERGAFAAARMSEAFDVSNSVEDFKRSLSELSNSELATLATSMGMAGASVDQLSEAMYNAHMRVHELNLAVSQLDAFESLKETFDEATRIFDAADQGLMRFNGALAAANEEAARAAEIKNLVEVFGSVDAALAATLTNFSDLQYAVNDALTPIENLEAVLTALQARSEVSIKVKAEMELQEQRMISAATTFSGVLENSLLTMQWTGVGTAIASATAAQMKLSIGEAVSKSLSSNLSESLSESLGGVVGGLAGSFAVGVVKLMWREFTKSAPELTNEELQARQGAGGVLGDLNKKNTTIADMTTKLTSINSQILGVNVGMLSALNRLNAAIGGTTTSIARSDVLRFNETADSFGKEMQTAIGSALSGAAAGAAIGSVVPIIGTVVGAVIGATAGAFTNFLKGSNEIIQSGLQVGGNFGDLMDGEGVAAFAVEKQKKWRWSSGKEVRQFRELDEQTRSMFGAIFSNMGDTMVEAFKSLGASSDVIDKAIVDMLNTTFAVQDINLKGLNAEQQAKEIEAVIGQMFDDVVLNVAPSVDQFRRLGESLSDTFFRLASDAAYGREMIESLGFQINHTFDNTVDGLMQQAAVFSDFFERFGGTNEAIRAMENFRTKFQSESEAFENQTRRLTNQFSQFGMVLPATREELYQLQQGLDLIADADKLEIIYKSADALDAYYKAMEKVNDEMNKAIADAEKEVLRAWKAFEAQSQDLTKSLKALISEEEALAYARELELAAIDPLLRETQQLVWQLEDEAKAKAEAARAGEEYNRQIRSSRDSLKSFRESIGSFIADIMGQSNNRASGAVLARRYNESLSGAKTGDSDAMGRVLGDARALLDYQQSTATSAFEQARNAAIMANQLKALGDNLTPEQILVATLEKGFSDLEKAMRGLPPELAKKLQSVYNEIDMVANIVMNDASLSPDMRELLSNVVSGSRTAIDLVTKDDNIPKEYKDLIAGQLIKANASLAAAFDKNVPQNVRDLLLVNAKNIDTTIQAFLKDSTGVGVDALTNLGSEAARVTIEAALGRQLSDEEYKLVVGGDAEIWRNIVATDNLEQWQRDLITSATGGDVRFDVSGNLVLGSSANSSLLTTAELAQKQLNELTKIYDENKLVVDGLGLLISEMGGLTKAINELAGINERQANIARANVRIAEIEASKNTARQRADTNIGLYQKEADAALDKMISANNRFKESIDDTILKIGLGKFSRYGARDPNSAVIAETFKNAVQSLQLEVDIHALQGMDALNKYAEDLETRKFYTNNSGLDAEMRKAMLLYVEATRADVKLKEYNNLVLKEQRLLTEALTRLSEELAAQKVIAAGGFAKGGYTGSGTRNTVAGVVHAGEYVIPANMLRQMGGVSAVAQLDAMRSGGEYQSGGFVGGIIASGASGSDYDELVYELKELRRELSAIKESNATIASNSIKAERRESKWDAEGLPQTRT